MNRISFDFDGCVGHKPHIQRLAQELCRDPYNEVHIITRRYGSKRPGVKDEVSDVLQIASILNIPKERIHFMDRQYKWPKIKELGIQIHWDDDMDDIKLIRTNCPDCRALLTLG